MMMSFLIRGYVREPDMIMQEQLDHKQMSDRNRYTAGQNIQAGLICRGEIKSIVLRGLFTEFCKC